MVLFYLYFSFLNWGIFEAGNMTEREHCAKYKGMQIFLHLKNFPRDHCQSPLSRKKSKTGHVHNILKNVDFPRWLIYVFVA